MTASPDDAAGSSSPPRAEGGPAAPSFPGIPGTRQPEESPMSQAPGHDETMRIRNDGPDSRPPVEPSRPVSAEGDTPEPQNPPPVEGEVDDTRPVPRDWLDGAPGDEALETTAHVPPVEAPAVPPPDAPFASDLSEDHAITGVLPLTDPDTGDGPPPPGT